MSSHELTLEYAARVLMGLSIVFPEVGLSDADEAGRDHLRLFAGQYWEDAVDEGMSAEAFARASKWCRRNQKFFPKPADIIAAHREIVSRPPRQDAGAAPDFRKQISAQPPREQGRKRDRVIARTDEYKRQGVEPWRALRQAMLDEGVVPKKGASAA